MTQPLRPLRQHKLQPNPPSPDNEDHHIIEPQAISKPLAPNQAQSLTPAKILNLQQTVGNQTVLRLLKNRQQQNRQNLTPSISPQVSAVAVVARDDINGVTVPKNDYIIAGTDKDGIKKGIVRLLKQRRAKYEILPVIPSIKFLNNESSLPTENQTSQTPQN